MHQLSALDTAFINLETGSTHTHITALGVYDPSTAASQPVRFKDIIKNLQSRLHKLPELRKRYVPVPLGLDYPYWIDDPDFDIEFHLRHIALPAPGDWRQLCIQTARLHSRPLDLNHSPWEIYVVEGLNNVGGVPEGSFGLVIKLHHALFDGQAVARLIQAMHDTVPVPPPLDEPQMLVVDRVPSAFELLARTPLNNTRKLLKTGKVVSKYALPLAKSVLPLAKSTISRSTIDKLRGKKKLTSGSTQAPRTRFNAHVSPHRVFDGAEFDLSDFNDIRRQLPGITINDIALGIVSGGLRRYLLDKQELPEQSLKNAMPINVAKSGDKKSGNKISLAINDLRTDIEDPKQRLLAIHASSSTAKTKDKASGGNLLFDFTQVLPNTATNLISQIASKPGVASKIPVMFNTFISNVQGPQIPIYHAGAKLVRFQGLGLPSYFSGLFHGIFSYNGKLSIGFACCRDMMPDPAFYRECMQESFEELKALVVPKVEQVTTQDNTTEIKTKKSAKADTRDQALSA